MAKVLVVDDAKFMRVRTAQLLTSNGFSVIEAENGEAAVEQYRGERPELVLMDITMPVMDGLTALKAIRAEDPQAKVVMISALGQENMVLEAMKAGAKDFIVKPYEPEKVLASVRRLVG